MDFLKAKLLKLVEANSKIVKQLQEDSETNPFKSDLTKLYIKTGLATILSKSIESSKYSKTVSTDSSKYSYTPNRTFSSTISSPLKPSLNKSIEK